MRCHEGVSATTSVSRLNLHGSAGLNPTVSRLRHLEDSYEEASTELGRRRPPAVLICTNCNHPIDDVQRWDAVKKGEWRPTKECDNKKVVGYFIWAAYSSWVVLEDIVREFLEVHHDPERFQVFVNTVWGEVWEEKLYQIKDESIFGIREKYKSSCPERVLLLTCSVDVQKNRVEGEVKGWGIGQECFGIDYFIIYGETDQEQVWKDLYLKLCKSYEHESGIKLLISITLIDSGYRDDMVHKFCKKYNGKRRIYATKGKQQEGRPILSKPSKTKYNTPLFILGVDALKERVYSRLQMTLDFRNSEEEISLEADQPIPGIIHYPIEYDLEYFEQLTAEKPKTIYKKGFPHREWIKNPGQRNEALDITVGNFAALEMLMPDFKKLKESLKAKIMANTEKKTVNKKQTYNQKNWVNGWKRY